MQIVVDTNVLVSATIAWKVMRFGQGPYRDSEGREYDVPKLGQGRKLGEKIVKLGVVCDEILWCAHRGQIEIAVSEHILEEFRAVLVQKFKFDGNQAQRAYDNILRFVSVIRPRQAVSVIPEDHPDNRVLECALEARADAIVTGDKQHLLPLKNFRGIPVLSPSAFMKTLRELPPETGR